MTRLSEEWVRHPDIQAVFEALEAAGHEAFFVGGCVRNAIVGHPVSDIDIATDALPEQTMATAKSAGLRAIPTGFDHGTITVLSGAFAVEITTFRQDVETDGRHARVRFSKTLDEDAARRDFTMNALYARRDGEVIDPINGLPDLRARRVRFIGNAQDRIQEDYLRSMRFFRFHAWFGDPDAGLDADALAAISANLGGLETVSHERIGAEFIKLLAAPDPAPSVAAMRNSGVLARVLPGADDKALGLLVHFEQGICDPDALRRLAILGGNDPQGCLRTSKPQTKHLTLLRSLVGAPLHAAEIGYRHGEDTARDALLLRAASFEMPPNPEEFAAAAQGATAKFPVRAADLMPDFAGKALGEKIAELEARWIASNFRLTKADLMRDIP